MNGYRRNMMHDALISAGSPAVESITVTTMRQRNRAVALQMIIRERQTTRADLARQCGLSAASAANIVAELIADGLVEEIGTVSSHGGRPIAVVAPRADGAYAIGADVGERGVAVELFDLSLGMVDREFRGGRHDESFDDIEADLRGAITALRNRNEPLWPKVLGVGLGLPGLVETDQDGEQTLYAQSNGWAPHPIARDLGGDLPVFAENGAKTQARAELWFGAARGFQHAVIPLLGRGVGLGVVTDGQLYRGAFSSATEWGHTKIRYGGELCRCGDRGCLEAYVGADALLDRWRSTGATFEGTGWQALGSLLDSAVTDATATSIVDDAIEALGAGLGSIINLTNPQRVVVGGWVGIRLFERYAERIHDATRRNCLARLADQFELVSATFGGDTVALGSALMPIEALINAPRMA
jgi:predicted NBD/HSP70 family sugar kinase